MIDIPTYWKTLPLRDFVITRKGKKPVKLLNKPFKDSLPYLDINAIENNNFRQFADILTTVISKKTDIFIVADGSRSGLVARGIEGAVGSTILCISPLAINSDFLLFFLKAKFEFLNKNTIGGSIPHLDQQLLLNLEIPIPPLDEQAFIAEELHTKIGEYIEDFKSAKDELATVNKYRQSVLDKAFSGILTAEWRIENNSLHSHTKKDLLKINKLATILERDSLGVSLPSSWLVTDAKSICSKITDGEHSTPARFEKGELLLSARNVRDGFLDLTNVDYISTQDLTKFRLRCNPERGDILIVSVGATIGRTSIVDTDKLFALVRSVLLLKPKISGEYLMYCLQSPILQDIIKASNKGVAQQHLYITETAALSIPFPSINEQKEIVRQIKEHFHTAEKLEQKTSFTIKRIDDLQRAIFQLAYSGALSENMKAPKSDEWFLELIENIKKERKVIKEKTLFAYKHKKIESKKLRDMMSLKKTIVEIIDAAGGNKISVEEAWRQSHYYERGEIEKFYEELEKVSKKNKSGKIVEWEFLENKNGVILKFK